MLKPLSDHVLNLSNYNACKRVEYIPGKTMNFGTFSIYIKNSQEPIR